uniref:G-protein coupled receptors family 1 profile domain-containing protein n=1 Tax=Lates calcarifer TaxID=8187 RepID=A0A4W6BHT8_LATCA
TTYLHSAAHHLSAHCDFQPAGHHLHLPLQAHNLHRIHCYVILLIIMVIAFRMIIFSYCRQLHTPTNLLLLSLAVSDFLVGLLLMPVEILMAVTCWILGDLICVLYYMLPVIIISASVGNMVLISVDLQLCIYLCWIFSAVHSTWILRDFLKQSDKYISCYGVCVVVGNFAEGVFDLIVTFLAICLTTLSYKY